MYEVDRMKSKKMDEKIKKDIRHYWRERDEEKELAEKELNAKQMRKTKGRVTKKKKRRNQQMIARKQVKSR